MDELKRPFPYCSLAELGDTLAESRRERKLSLDDISTMTCIRNNFLEDIESGDFSRFTSWVYARGFVRTYLNLMNRMELWPYYDRFLSDTPPTMEEMGLVTSHPPREEEFEQEPIIEESLEQVEKPVEAPVIRIDEASQIQFDEVEVLADQEPVEPLEEPVPVKIYIPSAPSVQSVAQENPLEEDNLTPLVSEAELPAEGLGDEPRRVEKPTTKARQQQPDPITVKLPPMPRRSGEGRSSRAQHNPETSKNADTPLLMNALTRRTPPSRSFRRRSNSWVLLLLSLALVGGLVTFWMRRGAVSDEMERMRQQQAEVQRLTEEAARQEQAQASAGMGADVVDVVPENEPTAATPVAEPVASTLEVVPTVPETIQPAGSGTLVVKANGECWLEVSQGERKLFASILKRGDQQTFPLTQDLRVVYGAPQVVAVTVNGEERGAPGNGVTRLIYKPDGTSTPFKR